MNDFHRSLRITSVKRSEHFFFNLLEFRFFRDSERGVAMPFGNLRFLSNLVIIPYVLVAELIFFRGKRYLVRSGKNVVGSVVFHERSDSLLVASLGVAKEYRRLGTATFILGYAERVATSLGKEWLELTVLKANVPAQRLYVKLGFRLWRVRKRSFILRKKTVSFRVF